MHDIMSKHRVLQSKCWFAKGKKNPSYKWDENFISELSFLRVFAGFLVQELNVIYF